MFGNIIFWFIELVYPLSLHSFWWKTLSLIHDSSTLIMRFPLLISSSIRRANYYLRTSDLSAFPRKAIQLIFLYLKSIFCLIVFLISHRGTSWPLSANSFAWTYDALKILPFANYMSLTAYMISFSLISLLSSFSLI